MRQIVLCLGGSFNPVHINHIDAIVKAKEWLEDKTDFKVVSGFLVVTTDEYLKVKFINSNTKLLTKEHRLELCRIAVKPFSWLNVYPETCASAFKAAQILTKADSSLYQGIVKGDDKCTDVGRGHWQQKVINSMRVDIILGRGEEMRRIEREFCKDLQENLVNNNNIVIVPEIVGGVSSTSVRKLMENIMENQKEIQKVMPEGTTDYLVKHRKRLYIKNMEKDYLGNEDTHEVHASEKFNCLLS